MGQSVDEFFETLKHQTEYGQDLPNWYAALSALEPSSFT